MFETTSSPSESSNVVLSGFARKALAGFRLPMYSAFTELFGGDNSMGIISTVLDVMSGFREQFGAPEIRPGVVYSAKDFEEWLLYKVDEHICPLDTDFCTEVLYMCEDESALWGPVPIQTYGIAWEMTKAYNVDYHSDWGCLIPLLALGYRSLPADDRVGDALLLLEEYLQDVAMDMGGELPEMSRWDILTRLEELPAPIGPGLAAGWKLLWRGSGNIFLDTISPQYMGDYEEFFFDVVGASFSVHDLKGLAVAWQEAKPVVDAYYEYVQWWSEQPNAKAQVERELMGLFGDYLGVGDDDDAW